MRPFLNFADGIVGIGSLAVESYQALLNRDLPITNIPYLCRLDQFQTAASQRLQSLSEPPPPTILYCGQLIPRKGLETLIHAFQHVRNAGYEANMRLVGTGPLHQSLREMLSESERNHVEFTGFRPVDELPRLFSDSDIFVLPSLHDGWGVVVNQALASGLPIIYSDQVGAGYDLVQEGVNGYRFPAEDAKNLTEKLMELAERHELRTRMGLRSFEAASQWTPARGVEMWREFAEQILDLGSGYTTRDTRKMISN